MTDNTASVHPALERFVSQADRPAASATPSDPVEDARVAALAARLGPLADRFALRWVDTCESTNSELSARPPADDGRVHVLIATDQRAGRGRRGRAWQSWGEGSLTFSCLWRFPDSAPAPAGLSLAAGLALADALERLGVQAVQLKWPNDVLIDGRKLAGILVELLPGRGRTPAAVIGIGLNLQLPDGVVIPDQPAVADLHQALGASLPPAEAILAALLDALFRLFETYASAGFAALRGAWEQRNAFAGRQVCVSGEGEVITGVCAGVDDDGALLVRSEGGLQRILSGDVSLREAS
jgi:BirA family biotin operon repressor/biotin-[acetyl-CoA-carboxylase] ligase